MSCSKQFLFARPACHFGTLLHHRLSHTHSISCFLVTLCCAPVSFAQAVAATVAAAMVAAATKPLHSMALNLCHTAQVGQQVLTLLAAAGPLHLHVHSACVLGGVLWGHGLWHGPVIPSGRCVVQYTALLVCTHHPCLLLLWVLPGVCLLFCAQPPFGAAFITHHPLASDSAGIHRHTTKTPCNMGCLLRAPHWLYSLLSVLV